MIPNGRTIFRRVADLLIVVAAAAATQPASAASGSTPSGPLIFFRTANADTTRLLRRVVRVEPRTGKSLPPIVPPSDFRSFVDAVQVGSMSFVAWTSKRDTLWLGAAGPDGRISRRWRAGSAGGFEVRPIPEDPAEGTGDGFVRISADGTTALLVNGRGRRFGRYLDLRSGAVSNTPLPEEVSGQIVEAAAVGSRFVLVGSTGSLATVGPHGEAVARSAIKLPAIGPDRIDLVDIVALSEYRAVLSYVTPRTSTVDRRRFIARYNARSGTVRVTRSFADPGGDAFAATSTWFEVFAHDPFRWTAGRIDGGPLRHVPPAGPGPRPAATFRIEPDLPPVAYVLGSASSRSQGFVFRTLDYENVNDMNGYAVHEVIEVEIPTARVLRRTRFGDGTGGRSTLPYAFDIRVS